MLSFDFDNEHLIPFKEKIDYVVISENETSWDAWTREEFQRNYIGDYSKQLENNDLILLSDLDEIPFAGSVEKMISDVDSIYFGLQMQMSYFAFDFVCVGGPEEKTIWSCAFKREALETYSANTLRRMIRYQEISTQVIESGGKHLSYFMKPVQIEEKIAAFSHQEFNTTRFLDEIDPAKTISLEDDFFHRNDFDWARQIPSTGYEFVDRNLKIFSDFFVSSIVSRGFIKQRDEIERQRDEIERQRDEIKLQCYQMEEQKLFFISSFSWKLTTPVRFAHKIFKRLILNKWVSKK